MTTLTLIIMRHAKASPDSPKGDDFGRPLTSRGKHDAARMSQWLRANFPDLARVLSSPAERTRQTVAAVTASWADAPVMPEVRWDPALYLAELPTLLSVLEQETTGPLLLVGHNPGLEELVWHLLDGQNEVLKASKIMPTAAVYALSLPSRGSRVVPKGARLLAHMRPRQLPELA